LSNAPFNPQYAVVGYLADPSQPDSYANQLASVNQSFQAGYPTGGSFNTISATNANFSQPSLFNANQKVYYPTYEEWSLQWQQQVGKTTSFSIGYVGNHGYHEPVLNNGVNSFGDFGGAPATAALPAFGEITEIQNAAGSNYNGFIATVKNQSKYITLLFNYTYSHALDEISNGGILPFSSSNAINAINPFNLAQQNYGAADYDNRNNFNANYIISLPYFGGPKLLTDGWQFTGTIFWHSGFPFSVTDGNAVGALEPNYGGTLLADVADPTVPHHCSGNKTNVVNGCFGANASTGAPSPFFADPTGFGGSQTRNSFYGPHFFNTDFAITKSFKIPLNDSSNFQVGMQGYNILNHPNFANPDSNFSDPTFGYIQSTASVPTSVFGSFLGGDASPRIIQLKAKFTF
jgi:hypothetical protein